jgi:Protein of unknown function (DUF3575)
MKKILLLTLIMTSLPCIVDAQQTEDLQRKNSIKVEVLSSMLYSNAFLLSYERVTKPNQSFSVTGGYQEFPKLTSLGTNIKALSSHSRSGYKVGGEYRFYLQKENKYRAPRGVYLGPFITYHDFRNKRLIEVDNNGVPEEATLKTSFSILNIGAQLGYQFVIGNRWTIDLILIGPAVSNYKAKIKLDGDFTFDIEDVQNEILLKLIEEFPLLEDVLTDKEATTSGRLDSWSFGYRYQLLLGYHFGRKKK